VPAPFAERSRSSHVTSAKRSPRASFCTDDGAGASPHGVWETASREPGVGPLASQGANESAAPDAVGDGAEDEAPS